LLFLADEKDAKKKRKKEKKKKKKKDKKKDRSQSRSPSREAVKPSQTSHRVSEHRDISPLVRVKSEFPEDGRNFGSGDRSRVKKYVAGHEKNGRVKEEMERRGEVTSHEHRRLHSPQRHGNSFDVRRDSRRIPADDGSQCSYFEKSSHHDVSSREGRSDAVKTEGRHRDGRLDSKLSSRKRAEESSGQHDRRDSQEKRQKRSSSSSENDSPHRARVVEPSRKRQSPDVRDDRQKRRRRSSSGSDDDRNWTRNDKYLTVVDRDRNRRWSRSPDREQKTARSDKDLMDKDARKHRHHNAR